MLLDERLDLWDILIPQCSLTHHPGRPVRIDKELRRTFLAQLSVLARMHVHRLKNAMRRKVKPMAKDFLCKIFWHNQATQMYLRFSLTMRMAISASTSSMFVSLNSPDDKM